MLRPATLRYGDVAGDRPFHAALVPVPPGPRTPSPHSHDFHELLLVVAGHGTHWVSGRPIPLRTGDLALVRPDDHHDFQGGGADGMSIVNVAFPSGPWHAFTGLAGLAGWDGEPAPVAAAAAGEAVFGRFTDALASYSRGARAVDVVRLWAEVLPLLGRREVVDGRPAWLVAACAALATEENLQVGLPRLRALAAVSDGHLARTMAEHHGCTPVAFVTACRLDHAALLLTTTTDPVGRIAQRCGFGSQSYFARLFLASFGHTPRDHRERSRRAVVP